jgi:hypothetical protein
MVKTPEHPKFHCYATFALTLILLVSFGCSERKSVAPPQTESNPDTAANANASGQNFSHD